MSLFIADDFVVFGSDTTKSTYFNICGYYIRNDIVRVYNMIDPSITVVGSAKVNFLSYRYRADKSINFGMRGLWGLNINSGRGATLKYLWDGHKRQKTKMAAFLVRKVIISASILVRKAWLGSKLGDSGSRNPCMWFSN